MEQGHKGQGEARAAVLVREAWSAKS